MAEQAEYGGSASRHRGVGGSHVVERLLDGGYARVGEEYAILEAGHEYVFEEGEINYHFELTAYTHHPMIMGVKSDGTPLIKDVIFTKDSAGNITGIESVPPSGRS